MPSNIVLDKTQSIGYCEVSDDTEGILVLKLIIMFQVIVLIFKNYSFKMKKCYRLFNFNTPKL